MSDDLILSGILSGMRLVMHPTSNDAKQVAAAVFIYFRAIRAEQAKND